MKKLFTAVCLVISLLFGCSHTTFNTNSHSGYDNVPTVKAIEQATTGVYRISYTHKWEYEGAEVFTRGTGTCLAFGDYLITTNHGIIQKELYALVPFMGWQPMGGTLLESKHWIHYDNEKVPVKLIKGYVDYDIALLKRPAKIPKIPYACGKSINLERGDWIYIVGYPLAFFNPVITSGIVAGRGEPIKSLKEIIPAIWAVILYDVTVNSGNSGSPIFALKNGIPELVGIVNATLTGEHTGICFGVGIDTIRDIILSHEGDLGCSGCD